MSMQDETNNNDEGSKIKVREDSKSESNVKVIKELTKLLQEEPIPLEYDIASLRSTEDGEPKFIKVDINLGLHLGDLGYLAKCFRKECYKLRAKNASSNNDDDADWQTWMMDVTSCLLLVCPDNSTAWADRRRIITSKRQHEGISSNSCKQIEILQKERKFLNLLMTRHTKAPSSWFHRKYIFHQLIEAASATDNIDKDVDFCTEKNIIEIIKDEISVCIQVAERYPKNYYAWTFRYYVLNYIFDDQEDKSGKNSMVDNWSQNGLSLYYQLLHDEWISIAGRNSKSWLYKHVSDHSAAHFGGNVLRLILFKLFANEKMKTNSKILDTPVEYSTGDNDKHSNVFTQTFKRKLDNIDTGLSLILHAMDFSRSFLLRYPDHEVLWIFRRICAYIFMEYISINVVQPQSHSDYASEQSTLWLLDDNKQYHFVMELFWKQEIIELVFDSFNDEDHIKKNDKLANMYSLTYAYWICKQMKLNPTMNIFFDEQEKNMSQQQNKSNQKIEVELLSRLSKCETVVHNIYRIHQRNEKIGQDQLPPFII